MVSFIRNVSEDTPASTTLITGIGCCFMDLFLGKYLLWQKSVFFFLAYICSTASARYNLFFSTDHIY